MVGDADVVAMHDHRRADGEPGVARLDDGSREIDARNQRVNACDSTLFARGKTVLVVDA